MNEIIDNIPEVATETVEVVADNVGRMKTVIVSFAAGVATGIGGLKVVKWTARKLKTRKNARASKDYISVNQEEFEDENVIEMPEK